MGTIGIGRARDEGRPRPSPETGASALHAEGYNGLSMRRLVAITAFALFLAVPLWAQHGGGGHGGFGGGHAGGFSGGHGGFSGHSGFSGGSHFGGGHFSSGVHSASGSHSFSGVRNGFSSSGFSRAPYAHDGFRGRDGFGRGFRGRDGFGRGRFGWNRFGNCYGYGCWGGYPYGWGGGYYDPWLWDWWDSDSSYDNDYNDNLAIANQMDEESYERQQQMLRQEQADGDQDLYAQRAPSRNDPPPIRQQGSDMFPATVLVFRDQHQQEIRNYAIVGETLWNFAPQHTQKIPLSELNLPATEKANDDRGVTFRIPNVGEGQ